MAIDDGDIDAKEFARRIAYGCDTTPLVAKVPDPPAGWGTLTSTARTLSAQYVKFLSKHKEVRND